MFYIQSDVLLGHPPELSRTEELMLNSANKLQVLVARYWSFLLYPFTST